MTESSSYSSLLELVDSHLSKSSLKERPSEETDNTHLPVFRLPSLHNDTALDSELVLRQDTRLPIPSFNMSDHSITTVLAEQVTNMLKAKAKKEKEERLAKEMNKLHIEEENEHIIDLMPAIRVPGASCPVPLSRSSSGSSSHSLFEPTFLDCEIKSDIVPIQKEQELPCKNDMSYILKQRVRKGRCSEFGKVLVSRLRTVPARYRRCQPEANITRFQFSTKSPCDLIKEKLKRPTCHAIYIPQLPDFTP